MRHHSLLGLLIAVVIASIGPGAARGAWPDGDYIGWNAPGMAVPAAPFAPMADTGMTARCEDAVGRTADTAEDAEVTSAGWRLTSASPRGGGIALIGGFLNFDAMCRPVRYQWFVFVDGAFAGTLAPEPMAPRTDGALSDLEIIDPDRVRAVYDRYAPTDGLCCPSGQTVVTFQIERTADGPVAVPEGATASPSPGNAGVIAACASLGGDGLTLVQWTPEEVADYEARIGPLTLAHPATGACADPAGLPLGWGAQMPFSWVCATTADGRWYGPSWTAEIYLPANAVAPDPAIGGCPTPRDQTMRAAPDTQQAAATAVYLSQLEEDGDAETLYEWMHPHAQAVVPRAAVVGWYTADFLPLGPRPITVTDVEIEAWTWGVTGTSYERTAVVSFEQVFADGSVITDVVRLVQDDGGTWRWFFGRDAAFVNQQIDRFGDE